MNIDYDKILNDLTKIKNHQKQIILAKLKEQINSANAEADAYYDGVYDAIRTIRNEIAREQKQETNEAG